MLHLIFHNIFYFVLPFLNKGTLSFVSGINKIDAIPNQEKHFRYTPILLQITMNELVYHSSPIPLMPFPPFDSVLHLSEQLNVFIINIFPSYFIDFEYDGFELPPDLCQ
eukprot:536334_1